MLPGGAEALPSTQDKAGGLKRFTFFIDCLISYRGNVVAEVALLGKKEEHIFIFIFLM